jgi:thiamine-monophosphate kinase
MSSPPPPKAGARRAARVALFKTIFAVTCGGKDEVAAFADWRDEEEEEPRDEEFFAALKSEFFAGRGRIENALSAAADRPLADISAAERAALLAAATELLSAKTPPRVAINEALEIARRYGSGFGVGFVNAVLDRVARAANRRLVRAAALGEREIIARFASPPTTAEDVLIGVGDDAAVVKLGARRLAISTDALVCETHFSAGDDAFLLGRKTLAISLSDMAAMGAKPRWALLSATLHPRDACAKWTDAFAAGVREIAAEFGVALIGGDTSGGETTVISSTVLGESPPTPLLRSGAHNGDSLWVSGEVGGAALALAVKNGEVAVAEENIRDALSARLHNPIPRVGLGGALVGIATAAMDISDGLLAGARALSESSNLQARIDADEIPAVKVADIDAALLRRFALGGGDDYELLFAAPPNADKKVLAAAKRADTPVAKIGVFAASPKKDEPHARVFCGGVEIAQSDLPAGYEHFRDA